MLAALCALCLLAPATAALRRTPTAEAQRQAPIVTTPELRYVQALSESMLTYHNQLTVRSQEAIERMHAHRAAGPTGFPTVLHMYPDGESFLQTDSAEHGETAFIDIILCIVIIILAIIDAIIAIIVGIISDIILGMMVPALIQVSEEAHATRRPALRDFFASARGAPAALLRQGSGSVYAGAGSLLQEAESSGLA
jgi:hypothetical protein